MNAKMKQKVYIKGGVFGKMKLQKKGILVIHGRNPSFFLAQATCTLSTLSSFVTAFTLLNWRDTNNGVILLHCSKLVHRRTELILANMN